MDVTVTTGDDRIKLEDLPPEIFHLTFDYLTGDHILKAFLNLNKRFNNLIQNLRLNTIDLAHWNRREITDFFKRSFSHLTTNSLSLKLTNQIPHTDSCSANIEFIFSSLLDIYQLKYLFNNLQQLIFIRPIIDSTICFPDIILQTFLIYSFNNKIIFRKNPSQQRLDSLIICSNDMLRTVLTNHSNMTNQILISTENSMISRILPLVRHLKLYIDNYQEQWNQMSTFISSIPMELTLLIFDNKFGYYNGSGFSSLLRNLSNNCHLHFYLQFLPNQILSRRDIDGLFQSFQTDFYIQHQANVAITYGRHYQITNECPLLIYTSPFSAWRLPLMSNQEMLGTCSDYTNLTQLILDPCIPDYMNMLTPTNPINLLSNLTSLEFTHTPWHRFNQMVLSINIIFRQISSRIHHIHFRSSQCSSFLIKRILPFYTFPHLRSLDITDNDENCSILSDILQHKAFCTNIFHLNIAGVCRVKSHHIRELSTNFSSLQTLQYSMKLDLSYNEQLDTIRRSLLISMRTHLHYLHIVFEQENLLIMSMTPSESQLSEWLGFNQKQLMHVQAIELNRNQLSAWL